MVYCSVSILVLWEKKRGEEEREERGERERERRRKREKGIKAGDILCQKEQHS